MNSFHVTAFKFAGIVAFGGFIFGLDAALISGTVRFITAEFNLSDFQLGAVVSAPGFGVLFALLVTGLICDAIGRKKTLVLIASLYLVSAITSALAPSFETLWAARLLGGLAFTSLSLASMYTGEIAPASIRGKLVTMNQVAISVGLSAAYFSNYLLLQMLESPPQWMMDFGFVDNVWRWMLGMEIVPALLWLLLLLLIPESPRWLVLNKREDEARTVLLKLNPANEVDGLVKEIKDSALAGQESPSIADQIKDMFSTRYRMAITIGVTIALVQALTGINAIMFYAPTVFEQVGLGTDSAFFQSLVLGLVALVFTLVAIATIDRYGRRILLIVGLTTAAISLLMCSWGFATATYQLDRNAVVEIQSNFSEDKLDLTALIDVEFESDVSLKQALRAEVGDVKAKEVEAVVIQQAITINVVMVLTGLIAFIAAFNLSIGPIMWVIFSEIVPTHIRGVAIPFFGFTVSLASYFTQQFFPWQLTVMGIWQIFAFYATLVTIGLLLLIKLLPETRNRSIEEIEAELLARH